MIPAVVLALHCVGFSFENLSVRACIGPSPGGIAVAADAGVDCFRFMAFADLGIRRRIIVFKGALG